MQREQHARRFASDIFDLDPVKSLRMTAVPAVILQGETDAQDGAQGASAPTAALVSTSLRLVFVSTIYVGHLRRLLFLRGTGTASFGIRGGARLTQRLQTRR